MKKWHQMTKRQQDYARRITEAWWKAGGTATVSAVARHLDTFADWHRGAITADEVRSRTGLE